MGMFGSLVDFEYERMHLKVCWWNTGACAGAVPLYVVTASQTN